ncbi:MAG TPA: hypothetical protein DDY70_00650 [Clostridiales bacterium]|nr:hypothetical protein [Clostridiales bacterium]
MNNHKRSGRIRALSFLERLLTLLFFLLLLFSFDAPALAVMTLLSALMHEGGHLLALYALGIRGGRFSPHLNGMVCTPRRPLSYREEIIVAAAGPLTNLIFALLFLFLLPLGRSFFAAFIFCELLTALSNLLPVHGYDGERILTAVLASRGYTGSFAERLSLVLTVVLVFLSLFLIGGLGEGYWIFGVFFVSLLLRLKEGQNENFRRFREEK